MFSNAKISEIDIRGGSAFSNKSEISDRGGKPVWEKVRNFPVF